MKSLSHVQLFATLWTIACQAPPSMGFSRQGYWSGLPFPSLGIFPTQGSNLGLPHCGQILYGLSHQGSPKGSDHILHVTEIRIYKYTSVPDNGLEQIIFPNSNHIISHPIWCSRALPLPSCHQEKESNFPLLEYMQA